MRVPRGVPDPAELFQESGYTTLGVVSNAVLAAQFGWNDGFDEFLRPGAAATSRRTRSSSAT